MFHDFFVVCLLSSKSTFSIKILSGISSVSNSLDPDQVQCFAEPDMDPNWLLRSTEDDKIHHWQAELIGLFISISIIQFSLPR